MRVFFRLRYGSWNYFFLRRFKGEELFFIISIVLNVFLEMGWGGGVDCWASIERKYLSNF